jgi:aryl-alcohol dehydrogenase-like predicted oxidoreductase
MEYGNIGNGRIEVSNMCLGTWGFGRMRGGKLEIDRGRANLLLEESLELGINFIDTANVYGRPDRKSEEYIGEWLIEHDRGEIVIASKVGREIGSDFTQSGLNRDHIKEQIQETLKTLKTDYIDIYYIHRWDEEVSVYEALSTFDGLIENGEIDQIGVSTVTDLKMGEIFETCEEHGFESIAVAQPPLDITHINASRYPGFDLDKYLELCVYNNITVCAYSPLAGGFLTGKYTQNDSPVGSRRYQEGEKFDDKYISNNAWEILHGVESIAGDIGATTAQVALRLLMDESRFFTIPIIGVHSVEQLRENVKAAEIEIDEVYRNKMYKILKR